MKTVSFVSQKGGTGKTTLALNLAVEATRQGWATVVIDLDMQPSAMSWSEMRSSEDGPFVVDAKPARLGAAVDTARKQGVDLLVIDTGGRADEGAHAAAMASDLVVVPIQSSAIDLRSMDATRQILDRAGKPQSMVVLTRVKPFGSRHDETRSWLATNGFRVAPVTIGDRVTFQDAYAAGQTVAEYETAGKAAQEIKELYVLVCQHVDIPAKNDLQTSLGEDHGKQASQSRRAS